MSSGILQIVKKAKVKIKPDESLSRLRDAQALADFANLEPSDVGQFRRDYPDFVPDGWWVYQATHSNEEQWRMNQRFLRESWKEQFPQDDLYGMMRLVLSVFDPTQINLLDLSSKPQRPLFAELSDLPSGSSPYQQAVMFLFAEPWRARFCAEPECGKRFVAAEPKTMYCSEACTHRSRKRQKMAWWNAEGKRARQRNGKRLTSGKRNE
jgi:hypothetical protein